MNSLGRVKRELKEITEASGSDVDAKLVNNDHAHWRGTLKGPEDSPYDGGLFHVDIKIPEAYPFEPPKMKFMTKVWHPNVSSVTGAICLDILKDEWSPALTIRTALLSLQALLSCPEPDDPQDAMVATQYKSNPSEFAAKAKEWTLQFANPDGSGLFKEQLGRLLEMGFEKDKAVNALFKYSGDENKAIEFLFSQ